MHGIALVRTFVSKNFIVFINHLNEMKMKTISVYAALAAMIAYPMSVLAGSPNMGPTDGDDEIPIIVHGPHRGPHLLPAVRVEYNANSGTVNITFSKAVKDVRVLVCKNGVEEMEFYFGDVAAGSRNVIAINNMDNTEDMALYFVSAGEIFSVNHLD